MKIFLIPSQRILSPFGDPAADGRILDKPLRQIMSETYSGQALAVVPGWPAPDEKPPYLLAVDNLYISPGLLKKFLKSAQGQRGLYQLALRPCLFTAELNDLQETIPIPQGDETLFGFHLYWVSEGASPQDLQLLATHARPLPITIVEQSFTLNGMFSEAFGDDAPIVMPVTREAAFHLHHWSQLIWINFMHLYSLWASPSIPHYLKLAWKALTALSFNPMKIMGRMNILRGRAKIHPSAVVEGCIIENDVEIGPLSVVRYSYLGRKAIVESTADVRLSIIGEGALVCQNCIVNCSVLYPRSAAGHRLIQLSVLGEKAITTGGGYLIDMSYRKPIRVRFNGQIVSLKRHSLGCCIGHRALLGTGIWINAGREIPNDVVVARAPEGIISRVPDELPTQTLLINVDGTLVPLEKADAARKRAPK